jgi:hypothetical protein
VATQPKPFRFTAADLARLRATTRGAIRFAREAAERCAAAAEEARAAQAMLRASAAEMWASLVRCQAASAVRPFGERA